MLRLREATYNVADTAEFRQFVFHNIVSNFRENPKDTSR
jgi:hypothetical protein